MTQNQPSNPTPIVLAKLSIVLAMAAVVWLLLLHVVSPDFDPSWRMISEYAYGEFGWILTLFFLCWGISSWSAAASLYPLMNSNWGRAGIVLLGVSGLGEIMGGLFDVRHELHGAAFALGVPTLPIAALVISVHLARAYGFDRKRLLISAHATWISMVVMAVTMAIFVSGLKSAGAFHPETKEMLTALPAGVIAFGGYVNRVLVLLYIIWLMVIGIAAIKVYRKRVLLHPRRTIHA
ncbi:MAG: DUF998 domain-containing protein [Pseudomonadota bacterium]